MTLRSTIIATPIGDAVAVLSADGVVALRIADDAGAALARIADRLGELPEHGPDAAPGLAAALDGYFAGSLRRIEEPIDWRLVRGFAREALAVVCEIPYGETAGYGEVAALAGRPRAARAVGTACRLTPFSLIVPVHRVVRADGSPGEYGAHPEHKRFLLDHERDTVRGGG